MKIFILCDDTYYGFHKNDYEMYFYPMFIFNLVIWIFYID
jgi:hypothetical protein